MCTFAAYHFTHSIASVYGVVRYFKRNSAYYSFVLMYSVTPIPRLCRKSVKLRKVWKQFFDAVPGESSQSVLISEASPIW